LDAGSQKTGVLDGSAGDAGACTHPAYQPATCINAVGELTNEAARAWFTERGVKVAAEYPGHIAQCHELVFGAENDHVLACTVDTAAPGPMGFDGPIAYHRDLRVVTVRNHKAFEIVRLPVALSEAMHWDEETLFAARYEIDAAAGTVDLQVSTEECEAGRVGVHGYHQQWADQITDPDAKSKSTDAASMRMHVKARLAQMRLDDARIVATCSAVGHYALARGGRLERAK
jgi:hypothetical protein